MIIIRIADAGFVVVADEKQHILLPSLPATTTRIMRRTKSATTTASAHGRIQDQRIRKNPILSCGIPTRTTRSSTSLNSFLPARNFFSSVVRRRNKNKEKNGVNWDDGSQSRTKTVAEQIDDLVIVDDETRTNGEGTYYDDGKDTTDITPTTISPIMTKSSLFTSLESKSSSTSQQGSTSTSSSTDDREKNSKIVQEEFENDLTKVLKVLMPNEYDDPEVPGT